LTGREKRMVSAFRAMVRPTATATVAVLLGLGSISVVVLGQEPTLSPVAPGAGDASVTSGWDNPVNVALAGAGFLLVIAGLYLCITGAPGVSPTLSGVGGIIAGAPQRFQLGVVLIVLGLVALGVSVGDLVTLFS
jgi:hypothetical protein